MDRIVSIALVAVALAATAPAHAAEPCSELSIRNAGQAGPLHYDYGLDRMECSHPSMGETASFLVGRDVQVTWFHDEPGVEDLSVEVSGPGFSATFPMTEGMLSSGATYYDSPVFTLPEGFSGELTATLWQGTTVLATASAHTPL